MTIETCRCGHARGTHTHYNTGTYCGVVECGCPRYRKLRWYHRYMPATFRR